MSTDDIGYGADGSGAVNESSTLCGISSAGESVGAVNESSTFCGMRCIVSSDEFVICDEKGNPPLSQLVHIHPATRTRMKINNPHTREEWVLRASTPSASYGGNEESI